MFGIAGGYQVL